MSIDTVTLMEVLEHTFNEYENKRVEELLSTTKGSSRIGSDQMQSILGKAQGSREIKALLYTALGITV